MKNLNYIREEFNLETIDISTFGLNIDKKQTFVYHRNLIPELTEVERE